MLIGAFNCGILGIKWIAANLKLLIIIVEDFHLGQLRLSVKRGRGSFWGELLSLMKQEKRDD